MIVFGTYDTAKKTGPRLRSGVIRMSIRQSGIRRPHDLLQLDELSQESRKTVVDLRRISRYYDKTLSVLKSHVT